MEATVAGPLTLLPVIVAVVLTLWTRQVILSLVVAVATAGLLIQGLSPWAGLMYVVDPLLLDAIADRGHVQVLLFSLFVAATIKVVSDVGATRALVALVAGRARTRRGGMIATWLAGMVVFFDDYANCLVVGTTMRPLCDRLGISRAKLAYLVDSTAAPMATLALVSTWIGFEVGLMEQALTARGVEGSAYAFFLAGLPYRFYPALALAMGGLVAFTGRDIGPMREAESRARPLPDEGRDVQGGTGALALVALIPIGALVGVTAWSLWRQGVGAVGREVPLFEIVGGADGYVAMLEGSAAGLFLAVVLAGSVRVSRRERAAAHGVMGSVVEGMGELVEALVVLFLAWALGSAIAALGTADWLVGTLGTGLPPWSLPALTFALSAGIAFATGTSFGTMSVVMPLALPMAMDLVPMTTVAAAGPVPLATAAAVLSGATWGDHCSPISDTTVLASTGAGCDHGEHVATQLPYALVVGAIALLACCIPAGLGVNPWLLLVVGLALCALSLRLAGRVPAPAAAPSTASGDQAAG